MNRLYIYTLLGIGLLLNASCKRETLFTYNAQDNIYFNCIINAQPEHNYLGIMADSLNITFAFSQPSLSDTILGIAVKVTGVVRDVDREFDIVVDPASTAESKHYDFPYPLKVRAGRQDDSLFIRLKRTPDLKTREVNLVLRLKPNENFQTQLLHRNEQIRDFEIPNPEDTIRMTMMKLVVSDRMNEGAHWMNGFHFYYGDFSEKKMRLMNQITGIPLDFWSVVPSNADLRAKRLLYGSIMARYLSDQAFEGNQIMEEDNVTPMQMGYFFQ